MQVIEEERNVLKESEGRLADKVHNLTQQLLEAQVHPHTIIITISSLYTLLGNCSTCDRVIGTGTD